MKIDGAKYGGMCRCGKTHQMETRFCVIEAGALSQFDDYLARAGLSGRRCAVYDSSTYAIPGLRRPRARQEVVLEARHLHADENSTAELLRRLDPDIQLLIAVGGGTVHDIVRYCAKQLDLPFVSVPTSASCDGFCSNVAAMTLYGYKKTIPCRAPALVVADLDVISAAPWYLTASGVGDMLGKYVALADWKIAHRVTGEALCPEIQDIMQTAVDSIRASAPALKTGDPAAYETVTYGLLMSGLAMQMQGSSRPASGAEHHVSHFIELEPVALHAPSTALHGEKVGVGTILASREYHRMAKVKDIHDLVRPYRAVSREKLSKIFGPKLLDACAEENAQDCLAPVTEQALVDAWPDIRAIVSHIPGADELDALLTDLNAKHTLEDLGVPGDRLPLILDASPLIRNRLTLMRMRRMLPL
jgi:glycerol-1-phosphate dehydrogenase [NAD(P)+]